MEINGKKQRRDLFLEFRLSQWIEDTTGEEKPQKISFEDWISDGTVLSNLMRSLSFNSVENDFCEGFGGSDDLAKWRIRTLINQMKKYGVNEDILFHEDDLLYRNNIPKVVRSLKQVAMIAQNGAELSSSQMESFDE